MQFRDEPRPPTHLNEWASRGIVPGGIGRGIEQHYANAAQAQNNYVAVVNPDQWVETTREATRADLGIIDQNLDDKIGMEP